MALDILPADPNHLDLVSLGECMVRLSPPVHDRIEFARSMDVYVGGGEFNVAYALSRLGLKTGWVGGLVDNPVSAIIENHARAVGMDISHAPKLPYDGVGRDCPYRPELHRGRRRPPRRGHPLRPRPLRHVQDDARQRRLAEALRRPRARAGSVGSTPAASSPASPTPPARSRPSHSRPPSRPAPSSPTTSTSDPSSGLPTKRSEHTKPLVPYIDCLIGNEEDFEKVLGYEVEGADVESGGELPIEKYKDMVRQVVKDYPNLKVVGTTLREVISASENNWSALLYFAEDDTFYQGPTFERLILEDRVGGGDGFASGFAYAFLTGQDPQSAVNLGTAHGALLQTTRGDTSQITLKELTHVAGGGGARIVR